MFESLEVRRLLDAKLVGTQLQINGSSQSDNITITVVNDEALVFIDPESFRSPFKLKDFATILINCGVGDDFVNIDPTLRRNATVNGGSGNDTLVGGDGNDSIDGGPGDDVLDGGGLDLNPAGDTLIGGSGVDAIDYRRRNLALKIDFDGNSDDGAQGERDNVDPSNEVILGGGGDDLISSNLSTPVTLYGNGGNDTLSTSGGADRLIGGPGNDFLNSRDGDDTLLPGTGTDTLFGGTGVDEVNYYNVSQNVIVTLDGLANDGPSGENDFVDNEIENVVGGSGRDNLTGNDNDNVLDGGPGNDTLFALDGFDSLFGRSGNDILNGGDGDDNLDGGTGNDDFIGGAGSDTADYSDRFENLTIDGDGVADDGAFFDLPNAEADNVRTDIESIVGGSGSDRITARSTSTGLFGLGGRDTLIGLAGDDSLFGGPGTDVLDGGTGADFMSGGDGPDAVDYSTRTANLVVSSDDVANDGAAGELDNVGLDVEVIQGGSGNDSITAGDGDPFTLDPASTLRGNGGDDTLTGGDSGDSLQGGTGNDLLTGGFGGDTFSGGTNTDTVTYAGVTEDVNADNDGQPDDGPQSEQDDILADIEVMIGGLGDDSITGSGAAETIFGGDGDDVINGGGGNDSLNGDAGADSITGGTGTDTLNGGLGADTLVSADGVFDILNGGVDPDTDVADIIDVLLDQVTNVP
jgi:Ca2+-binding RTX toxin-like protein